MKKLYTFAIIGALAIGAFINLTSDTLNQNSNSETLIGPLSGTEVDGNKRPILAATEVDGFVKRRA